MNMNRITEEQRRWIEAAAKAISVVVVEESEQKIREAGLPLTKKLWKAVCLNRLGLDRIEASK
jgi:hypothetical protein